LIVLTPACKSNNQLADGCYYARGRPVFTVSGERGRALIPGNIKTFKIVRHGNGRVTFSPGMLFDGRGEGPSQAVAFPDAPPLSMKAGTAVPTVEMHWTAYGDESVSLGKPCL
jgi:hypothetical protein